MAPEMILGENAYNNKVDVWSYGIFLVELAVGEPPYINEKQVRILFNIANNPAPVLEQDRWSHDFCDFVACCLKKDPEERYSVD
jgi:serine/threonine protein kinase